jgi:hypothetical protein
MTFSPSFCCCSAHSQQPASKHMNPYVKQWRYNDYMGNAAYNKVENGENEDSSSNKFEVLATNSRAKMKRNKRTIQNTGGPTPNAY